MSRWIPGLITSFLVFMLLAAFFSKWAIVTIESGERGVLYRRFGGGTVVDQVYREGINIIWPWNRMYVYNVRVQERPHEMDALTKEGLKVHFVLSIRYHPEVDMLGVLHQRVGMDYVDKIVVPEVDSVVRTLLAKTNVDTIYGAENDQLQKIVSDAISQIEQDFVEVDDVVIRQLVLPASLEAAIEEKMTQKQLADAYKYRLDREHQEAERKKIEANGAKLYNEIISASLNDNLLAWKGIEATQNLAASNNAKVVVVGNGKGNLPIIFGGNFAGQ